MGAEDVAVSLGQPAMWLRRSEKKRFESSCGPAAACEREGGWPFGERRRLWGRDFEHGSGCAVAGWYSESGRRVRRRGDVGGCEVRY